MIKDTFARRRKYIELVRNNVRKRTTADNYANALATHLSIIIRQNVFEITDVEMAEKLRLRLLSGGDLHQHNVEYRHRVMSAAMKKYVAFLQNANY